jgi:hypothetical protein
MMKFVVDQIPDKGRGILLTKPIQEGEILFEESPVCSAQFSWGRNLGYKCCFNCMKPLETPVEAIKRLTKEAISTLPENNYETPKLEPEFCKKSETSYCGHDCLKEADYKYMKFLLDQWENVLDIEGLWRDIHFPPETATIMLIIKLLAIKRLNSDVGESLEILGMIINVKITHFLMAVVS